MSILFLLITLIKLFFILKRLILLGIIYSSFSINLKVNKKILNIFISYKYFINNVVILALPPFLMPNAYIAIFILFFSLKSSLNVKFKFLLIFL